MNVCNSRMNTKEGTFWILRKRCKVHLHSLYIFISSLSLYPSLDVLEIGWYHTTRAFVVWCWMHTMHSILCIFHVWKSHKMKNKALGNLNTDSFVKLLPLYLFQSIGRDSIIGYDMKCVSNTHHPLRFICKITCLSMSKCVLDSTACRRLQCHNF